MHPSCICRLRLQAPFTGPFGAPGQAGYLSEDRRHEILSKRGQPTSREQEPAMASSCSEWMDAMGFVLLISCQVR